MKILLKDLLEIEFIKQPAREQMHVTSNPFFAFHDDVFPAFAKNAAAQSRFPPSLGKSSKTRARVRTHSHATFESCCARARGNWNCARVHDRVRVRDQGKFSIF